MPDKSHILIIDDEEKLRQLFARIIGLEGFEVSQAASARQALKILEQDKNIDLILTDVKLPDGNGIDMLEKIRSLHPLCEVIVMTAYGTIHDGVNAMKQGAFDYFIKGDDNEQLIPAIKRAAEKVKLQKRVHELEEKLNARQGFEVIIGDSAIIAETIRLARKVAPTDSTVLLEGETGVGKELFAQAIHQASERGGKSFVAVNCSAFPKDLLESELFGYKKGAFTGALQDKKGLFEEAHEGTLFLDEIGEMTLELQAKLLRVLETQSFIKLGDSKPTQVYIRIIAATNRDLQKEIKAENFRMDLYYRLSTFRITVPSLRQRKGDIEALAIHFIQVYSAKLKKRISGMEPSFLQALQRYDWKGNIRELKNVIERSAILCDQNMLPADSLPQEIFAYGSAHLPVENSLAAMERAHIQNILSLTNGNKTKAAETLGIGLTTLYRKLEEYRL